MLFYEFNVLLLLFLYLEFLIYFDLNKIDIFFYNMCIFKMIDICVLLFKIVKV